MNRRTKSDWQELFNEHKQSGLTAVAFCQERNLNPKYFCLRCKQLQPKNEEKATSAFTPAPCVRIVVASNFYLEVMKNESKIYSII